MCISLCKCVCVYICVCEHECVFVCVCFMYVTIEGECLNSYQVQVFLMNLKMILCEPFNVVRSQEEMKPLGIVAVKSSNHIQFPE